MTEAPASLEAAVLHALDATSERVLERSALAGGSIHQVERWRLTGGAPLVLKITDGDERVFATEAVGLRALAAAGALRVPRVLGLGRTADRSLTFLALEDLGDGGRTLRDDAFFERLGQGLAEVHRTPPASILADLDATADGPFGFAHDNFLGPTLQPNSWLEDWPTFWRLRRLEPMVALLRARRLLDAELERRLAALGEQLDDLLATSDPPSLLHGDLWSGNVLVDGSGAPAVIDPATYFGHREADLAMTRLFGGFAPRFEAAYRAAWPLDAGDSDRAAVYELHHLLNHLVLFGGGYRSACLARLRRFD
ncbi:MAG: fructosamine kinase family protein [Acidobacteriota bacterium]